MKEKHIEIVAALLFFVGMMVIIVEANNIDTVEVNSVNKSMVGKSVMVKGYVEKVRETESVVMIKLKNGLMVVAFSNKFVDVFEGDFVTVEGKVIEYNGMVEINADKINVVP